LFAMPLSHVIPRSAPEIPKRSIVVLMLFCPVTQPMICVDGLTDIGVGVVTAAVASAAVASGVLAALTVWATVWASVAVATGESPAVTLLPKFEKLFSNSRRAQASSPQSTGGCAGTLGLLVANGLNTHPMTLDTTPDTNANGFGGETGTTACIGCIVLTSATRTAAFDDSVVVGAETRGWVTGSTAVFCGTVFVRTANESTVPVDAVMLGASG